jgi:hypothetical protein
MVFREKILRENFETKSKDFSPNKYELSKKCQVHNTTQHNTTQHTKRNTQHAYHQQAYNCVHLKSSAMEKNGKSTTIIIMHCNYYLAFSISSSLLKNRKSTIIISNNQSLCSLLKVS